MTVAETDIPVAELTTSMILTRALEVLNATGWCKEKFIKQNGQRCMAGAVYEVTGAYASGDPTAWRALKALMDVHGEACTALYNDRDATTWEDVQHVFNTAIKATTPKDEINGTIS